MTGIVYRHPISIAPMMDYTDRHFRYLLRLITRHTLLYTEMITTEAILHGDRESLLGFHPSEHPLALQLGGSDPKALSQCATIAQSYGFDEVNLNVGCPSPRVQRGRFGACLMKEPELVAECIAAMLEVVTIPVTVKTRIGVDEQDSYDHLTQFIEKVSAAGCKVFIVHARKAWLKGLSPKSNRCIPPLRYDVVYQLKRDFPHLKIVLNGGVGDISQIETSLQTVDGVMLGRVACQNPYFLSLIDRNFYKDDVAPLSRFELIESFIPYLEAELKKGIRLTAMSRHLLGIFHGAKGARTWRRYLSEHAPKLSSVEVIRGALQALQ